MPIITSLYAGVFGIIALVLASGAGRLRGETQISIGDGGNQKLLLAMRRHGNFIEYVPLALILLLLLELHGESAVTLHVIGAGLVVCRVAHAVGLKPDTMQGAGRFVGAAGTALIIGVESIWCIVNFVTA